MIRILSLIRTICHKLMWFYRNAVLFYIIFVVTHGENLWLSGDTGTLTINKMALPIEVSAEMVSYSYFYWKKYNCNWVTKLRSRYYCNMPRIPPKLIRCHWSFDPRSVKISGHTEQLGPCGSTSHFVNNRHSRVKTQGAACIRGFGQTDGRRKFELGIPQSRGAPYIRGASLKCEPKSGLSCRRQVVHPRPQTPQGESVAKPETPLLIILSIACK